MITALLSLLPLLAAPVFAADPPPVEASNPAPPNPNSFSINASIPLENPTTSGCFIIAQIYHTKTGTDPILQALHPICPSGTPYPANPTTGESVTWPLTSEHTGFMESDMIIYGGIHHDQDRTDPYMAKADCSMRLTEMQVSYLMKRSLTWNNKLQQLWDNTGNDFINKEGGGEVMKCRKDDFTYLPGDLWLPDPYRVPANDTAWSTPITLKDWSKVSAGPATTSPATVETKPSDTKTAPAATTSQSAPTTANAQESPSVTGSPAATTTEATPTTKEAETTVNAGESTASSASTASGTGSTFSVVPMPTDILAAPPTSLATVTSAVTTAPSDEPSSSSWTTIQGAETSGCARVTEVWTYRETVTVTATATPAAKPTEDKKDDKKAEDKKDETKADDKKDDNKGGMKRRAFRGRLL